MKIKIQNYEEIFSLENLFYSFKKFQRGKRYKKDVAEFELYLTTHLIQLHQSFISGTYCHGEYSHFTVNDSKRRSIHKASVADRVVHHAVYNALYLYFDRKFIFDSYSCRINKGTHRAISRFGDFARAESHNYTRAVWVLKCDVRKCFASVDQAILKEIIKRHIQSIKLQIVLFSIIDSFNSGVHGKGIPLGNLTSQLFINVYLNELDQWLKREMKVKKYIRYADDFVIFSEGKVCLENLLPKIAEFLQNKLKFEIRPDKVFIHSLASGVDFLGWVHFPHHRILRKKSRQRMFLKIPKGNFKTISSYLGLLSHGNGYKLEKRVKAENMIEYPHEYGEYSYQAS